MINKEKHDATLNPIKMGGGGKRKKKDDVKITMNILKNKKV